MTAEDLKKIRAELDITQAKMAEKMGLSRRGYQAKELGKRSVTKQDEIILNYLKIFHNHA